MIKSHKVVKILDEYTIIVNAGSEQGIEIGDKVQILDTQGSPVNDPETNEILGYVELIKDTVVVSDVLEKMCYCESTSFNPNEQLLFGLKNLSNSFSIAQRKRLNVDMTQISGGLRYSDEPIQVGDHVNIISARKIAKN